MKKIALPLFALGTLVLCAICIVQWRQLNQQRTEVATLAEELRQREEDIAKMEERQRSLETQRNEGWAQASELTLQLHSRMAAEANRNRAEAGATQAADTQESAPGKNSLGGFLSKMMEDPEMKEMMRKQQRIMIDQLYDPLLRRLDLSPQEQEQFKTILADQMMSGSEKALSLFGKPSEDRSEAMAQMTEGQKAVEQAMRDLLGENRYQEYERYQQTVGERMQLGQFQTQLAGSGQALSEPQIEQLLSFMGEEKKAAAASGQFPSGPPGTPADMNSMFAPEQIEKMLQAQIEINERVYHRAAGVLTEPQLASFGTFQTNQIQMMKLGMSMARQFMSDGNQSNPAP